MKVKSDIARVAVSGTAVFEYVYHPNSGVAQTFNKQYSIDFACSDSLSTSLTRVFDITKDKKPNWYTIDSLGDAADKCLVLYTMRDQKRTDGASPVTVTGKFNFAYPAYDRYFQIQVADANIETGTYEVTVEATVGANAPVTITVSFINDHCQTACDGLEDTYEVMDTASFNFGISFSNKLAYPTGIGNCDYTATPTTPTLSG